MRIPLRIILRTGQNPQRELWILFCYGHNISADVPWYTFFIARKYTVHNGKFG